MSTDTQTAMQRAAQTGYDGMERATREGSDESYDRVKDGAPEWITDAIKDAHAGGEVLPDDWTYSAARSAFECIAEADDPEDARHEWADSECDVYTSGRLAWLANYPAAVECCDEATQELGAREGILDTIAQGQYVAAGRIYDAILAACEEQAEDEDEDQ